MNAPPSQDSTDERELLDRFRHGDREAFGELHRRYSRRVLAVLLSGGLQESDAHDVSQEAWLKAFAARATFTEGNFVRWIATIAINASHDAQRRKRPDRLPAGYDESGPNENERRAMREIIERCFDGLAEANGDFAAAVLDDYLGLTTAELAAKYGVAAATIYTRLNRGRAMLRDCIEAKLT